MACKRVLDYMVLCAILKDVWSSFIFIAWRIKLSASSMPGPSVAVTELLAPQAFENKNSSGNRDVSWSMRTRTGRCERRIDPREGRAIVNRVFWMTHSELPVPKCGVIICAKDVFRAPHLLPKLNLFPSYRAGKLESQVAYKNRAINWWC